MDARLAFVVVLACISALDDCSGIRDADSSQGTNAEKTGRHEAGYFMNL